MGGRIIFPAPAGARGKGKEDAAHGERQTSEDGCGNSSGKCG